VKKGDLGFVHGLFFGQFVEDNFVAFGLVYLVDDFEAYFIDVFGVGLPV
jgi:hypothetical protein